MIFSPQKQIIKRRVQPGDGGENKDLISVEEIRISQQVELMHLVLVVGHHLSFIIALFLF